MTTDKAANIRTACICCNSKFDASGHVKRMVQNCDLLIAADGGAGHFFDMGIKPHVIIGDMDSIDAELWREDKAIQRIVWPRDKDMRQSVGGLTIHLVMLPWQPDIQGKSRL